MLSWHLVLWINGAEFQGTTCQGTTCELFKNTKTHKKNINSQLRSQATDIEQKLKQSLSKLNVDAGAYFQLSYKSGNLCFFMLFMFIMFFVFLEESMGGTLTRGTLTFGTLSLGTLTMAP